MSDLTSKVFAVFKGDGAYLGTMLCTDEEAVRNTQPGQTIFPYYLGIELKKVVNGELVDK
jgi:hypothetical protein